MSNVRVDARMALARYESSFASFGTEAHFTIKDVHVVKEYIEQLEAALRMSEMRFETLKQAYDQLRNRNIQLYGSAGLEGKDDKDS